MPVALAWELLHLAMLIHDDIIDSDLIRYGVNNIAGSYREIYQATNSVIDQQERLATGAALLAGDLALSAVHELILSCNLPTPMKLQAHRYLTNTIIDVVGGQLLDMEAPLYALPQADPMLIARFKTASYSFVGPLMTGALLAGASDADCAAMKRLGEVLGCGFQLQDDLLGVFGHASITGKSIKRDLSEGKCTYLMQQTFALAAPGDVDVLQALVGKEDLTDTEADTVREIIVRCGAKKQTQDLVRTYADQARAVADGLRITPEYRQQIYNLIALTTERAR